MGKNITSSNYPHSDDNEFAKLQSEFNRETPRAVAIVGYAYLDDFLKELLKATLIENKRLFKDFTKRLNSEQRINMCYLLGLIDERIKDDLKQIKNIRNEFAHDKELNSFDKKNIGAECEKLDYLKRVKPDFYTLDTPRNIYIGAISYYFGFLKSAIKLCKRIDGKTLFNVSS